jgi:hypothetical protein
MNDPDTAFHSLQCQQPTKQVLPNCMSLLLACLRVLLPTSVHSMHSILLMQLGPQPSPPRQGGGQWQTMMSSSSCSLRLRWLK